MRRVETALRLAALGVTVGVFSGCNISSAIGVIQYNLEREKKIEVLAEYDGLRDETVAVIVQADHLTLYDFPDVVANTCVNIARRLQQNVENIRVLDPKVVLDWTYRTPSWSAMPLGEVVEELGVDRVVLIDIYEFRLNPPGNRWVWEGVATASIGIVEKNGFDPDSFSEHWDISVEFPKDKGYGREHASEQAIQTGLLTMFVQKASWLFYDHIEKKYPDV